MNPDAISRKINDCTDQLSAEKSLGEQYRLCSQMADYTRHLVLENKTEPLKAILHCTHGKEMMRALPNLFRRLIIGQIVYSGL